MKQAQAIEQAVRNLLDHQEVTQLADLENTSVAELTEMQVDISLLGERIWKLMTDRYERAKLRTEAATDLEWFDDYLDDPCDYELFIFGLFERMAWALEDEINQEIAEINDERHAA